MIRTHEAGTLRAADAGATVVLAGWVARRRDHGGVIFVDLRTPPGVQVVSPMAIWRRRAQLRAEYCVAVTHGPRREGNENPTCDRRGEGPRPVWRCSAGGALPFQVDEAGRWTWVRRHG